jgi:hypothetical protein
MLHGRYAGNIHLESVWALLWVAMYRKPDIKAPAKCIFVHCSWCDAMAQKSSARIDLSPPGFLHTLYTSRDLQPREMQQE